MGAWIFVALIVIIGAIYFMSSRKADMKVSERFAGREPIEFDEFYDRHYAGTVEKELVRELVDHVSRELSIPAKKLLPDDRFDRELAPLKGWEFDSGQSLLFVELGRLAKEKGKEIRLDTIKTLDDYIRAMAQVY